MTKSRFLCDLIADLFTVIVNPKRLNAPDMLIMMNCVLLRPPPLSVRTQVPFEFYQLPFCRPTVIEQAAENLGEVMSGDVIQNSNYEVCKLLRFLFAQEALSLVLIYLILIGISLVMITVAYLCS